MVLREDERNQGIAQGLKQGEHNAKLDTARNALAIGLTQAQAAQFTGLSVEEIKSIKL